MGGKIARKIQSRASSRASNWHDGAVVKRAERVSFGRGWNSLTIVADNLPASIAAEGRDAILRADCCFLRENNSPEGESRATLSSFFGPALSSPLPWVTRNSFQWIFNLRRLNRPMRTTRRLARMQWETSRQIQISTAKMKFPQRCNVR